MQKLFKHNLLIIFLSSVLLFSCTIQDDDTDPAVIIESQRCIVTSIVLTKGNYQYTTGFRYDPQRTLVTMTNKDNNGFTNDSLGVICNAAGKVERVLIYDKGAPVGYKTYTYDPNGLLTKISGYSGQFGGVSALFSYSTFSYTNGKLTKRDLFDAQNNLLDHTWFTYPSVNTARKEVFQIFNGDTLASRNISEFTFDNNKSVDQLLGVLYNEEILSLHNPLTRKVIDPGIDTVVFSYSYNYTSDGFPASATTVSDGTPYSTTTYTYNCQ